ncbi:MAG: tetratricopeptide repeat protein [Verrucomicrobiaceae bacterium]
MNIASLSTKTVLLRWLAIVVRRVRSLSCRAAMALIFTAPVFGHGTYHEMIEELQQEMAQKGEDHALMTRRAFIHVEHEDWKAALADLERARRLGADDEDLRYLAGRALSLGGLLDEAKKELDTFIQNHPEPGLALVERARVLQKLGEPEKALEDYRAALKAKGRLEPELVVEVAEALAARNQREEALRVLTVGIEVIGAVPQLVLKAMEMEIAAKRFDDALKRVETMQRLMPRPEPWMARRAEVLMLAGREEEASAAWKALRTHIDALPNLERGSHAMSVLARKAALEGREPPQGAVSPPTRIEPLSATSPPIALPPAKP